mgnify:CR=1 FL=1
MLHAAVIQDQWSTGECIYLPDRKFFISVLYMEPTISVSLLANCACIGIDEAKKTSICLFTQIAGMP